MAPRQKSERRLTTTSRDNSEANWNRMTDGQGHVLSQADAYVAYFKTKPTREQIPLHSLYLNIVL